MNMMNITYLPPELTPAATEAVTLLLRLLADPAAAQAKLDGLVATRDEWVAARQGLGDAQAVRTALQADRDAFAAECSAERNRLQAAQDVLNRERAEHDKNLARHEFETKKLERDRADLEASRRQHAAKFAEFERFKSMLA